MNWSRLLRHFLMTRWRVRSAFSPHALAAIEAAIAAAERAHGGEIRFAVEGELDTMDLFKNVAPRERALAVFGRLGVWDTEQNNGVLIYVLLADRDVEIVADRGYVGKVSAEEWSRICGAMETHFRNGDFERGAVEGVAAVSQVIGRHFPIADRNELPNQPALL